MRCMQGLSVRNETYVMLYTRCAQRFPNIALLLPKPPFAQSMPEHAPTALFSFQAPTSLPSTLSQPWPAPPIPSSTSQPTSHMPPFFRSRARPEGCAFCLQSGHRIRECPSAQEYVRLGHALVLGDRLSLPNGQPIPNDGTGHGLKHGIDIWLTAHTQITPAPKQPIPFTHETPPHLCPGHNNCMPSARIEEIAETHIIQVISDEGDSNSKADDEGPYDFFQVFATEQRKRET